jgi:cytochrome c-type biogenesis protein CcmH
MKRFLLSCLLMLLALPVFAQALDYRNEAEERRFRALTEELRCVMCQNQSLADSNAPIAHDLRIEILRLMREGKSDAQIKQYLVERYTDFVLYRPEVKPMTWLLWFGPGLLVLGGAVVIAVIVRRRSRDASAAAPAAANDSQEW